MRKTFVTGLLMAVSAGLLAGCGVSRIAVTETRPSPTEAAICVSLGEALPTRSRSDTARTQTEIGEAYEQYADACPDFVHLIPA